MTGGFEQATFLHIASAEVVTIKMWAFLASRGFHELKYYKSFRLNDERAAGFITKPPANGIYQAGRSHTRDVFASLCIDTNDVAHLDKLRALYFKAGLGFDLLCHTGGGIATDGGLGFDDLQIH